MLHPAMADLYRQKVTDLAAALNAPDSRTEAAEILRGLIETIELRPDAGRATRSCCAATSPAS